MYPVCKETKLIGHDINKFGKTGRPGGDFPFKSSLAVLLPRPDLHRFKRRIAQKVAQFRAHRLRNDGICERVFQPAWAQRRLAEKLRPSYDLIGEQVRGSPRVVCDETGWGGISGPSGISVGSIWSRSDFPAE